MTPATSAPPRHASLRGRLLRGTSLAVALIFIAAGVVLYVSIRLALVREFDSLLVSKARTLTSLVEEGRGGVKMELDHGQLPEYSREKHPEYFELWLGDGSVRTRSLSLGQTDLNRSSSPGKAVPVVLKNGRSGRAVTLVFSARVDEELSRPPAQAVTLVVARETESLDEMLERVLWTLVIVSAAATLAAMAVMAYVVRVGLRPAAALASDIAAVSTDDLGTRIRSDLAPTELLPVVDRLNDLLGRLQSAFDREKTFTADVAHELRTPLAGLEAALEVCVSRPREPEAYELTARRCLRTTREMAAMVGNLLLLTRADAQQLAVGQEQVDVTAMMRRQWAELTDRAEARKLQSTFTLPESLEVMTDSTLLSVVLRNLLENAVTYTNFTGTLHVSAASSNGTLSIVITNTGSSLAPGDAEKVFDRFWRGDASRSAGNTRCGIGLPLCRRLVATLGGTITATSLDGQFKVTVELPGGARQRAES